MTQTESRTSGNAWGSTTNTTSLKSADTRTNKCHDAATNATSLKDIMNEQQELSSKLVVESSNEEDLELKKAIEASLKNQNEVKNSVDADLEMAIKLSLAENTSTEDSDAKKSVDLPLKEDPVYANYFLMKEMNVEISTIKQSMEQDALDPSILDFDAEKSLEENQKLIQQESDDLKLSYELALQLQREENQSYASSYQPPLPQRGWKNNQGSNLQSVSRAEFLRQKQAQQEYRSSSGKNTDIQKSTTQEEYDLRDPQISDDEEEEEIGFRLNTNTLSSWTRSKTSPHTIIGPNGECRTKHDVDLKHKSNAERLLLEKNQSINDRAYNSFHQKLKRHTTKGVAAHGHGKSESYQDKTHGGALDASVRFICQKAVNLGIIERVNGVVSEGKEAIVYHADNKRAIKVFKRIQEFRNRGEYVDGDVRYYNITFSDVDKRKQVELWAEKEYRNLLRANKAGIPTPTPYLHKENVLFMKFLSNGEDHEDWPAPKLKDITLKKGSSKWIHFYCQTLAYVKKLYHCGRLVHADLSEYNILICPSSQIHYLPRKDEQKNYVPNFASQTSSNPQEEDVLQVVFIDFGQAVDKSHPSAHDYLKRDVERVQIFFSKIGGIPILSLENCLKFILEYQDDFIQEFDDDDDEDDDDNEGWEITPNENDYVLVGKEDEKEEQEEQEQGSTLSKLSKYASKVSWRRTCDNWDDEKEYDAVLKKVVR